MTNSANRQRLPRNVWILGFVSLLMDLSSEIYHALLPLFITVTLGLPVAVMGTILAVLIAVLTRSAVASFGWSLEGLGHVERFANDDPCDSGPHVLGLASADIGPLGVFEVRPRGRR